MMNPRQSPIVPAPTLRSVVVVAAIVGLLVVVSGGRRAIGIVPPVEVGTAASSAPPDVTSPPQLTARASDDLSPSGAQAQVASQVASHETSGVAMTGLSAAGEAADAPAVPQAVVEAVPAQAPDVQAVGAASMQVASANPSDLEPVAPDRATTSIEIVDECLVVDVCIDRYLWALYQRTPKEDAIKVLEWRDVTVRRKRKMVTVSRAFTRLVDQDFAWKDPKAAEHVGMAMVDYVIGGMDRSFKLKLFHLLHAAEAAGLSPGITSGFRDDYRQSIASGLKAANNRSYHGGSLRGGYGHGLAADVVSVEGGTRDQRFASSTKLWTWVDAHGKEFGIGRPYLGRDPPHVAPLDGEEYAKHHPATRQVASAAQKVDVKKTEVKKVGAKNGRRIAARDHSHPAKRPRTAAVSKQKAS
ncbi:MAG: peptidase M15 [Pseudomonadota bacterium]